MVLSARPLPLRMCDGAAIWWLCAVLTVYMLGLSALWICADITAYMLGPASLWLCADITARYYMCWFASQRRQLFWRAEENLTLKTGVSAAYPSFKTPREPRRGGISDVRSSSVKQNLTKIGALVLLIITKNILSKSVCEFQRKTNEKVIFKRVSLYIIRIRYSYLCSYSCLCSHILFTYIEFQEASQTNIKVPAGGGHFQ